MTYGDFWRRYRILSDSDVVQIKSQPGVNEVRPVVEQLLQYLDLDKTAARLGNTQVGFLFSFLFRRLLKSDLKLTRKTAST
jgi:myosin heavy subunit